MTAMKWMLIMYELTQGRRQAPKKLEAQITVKIISKIAVIPTYYLLPNIQ